MINLIRIKRIKEIQAQQDARTQGVWTVELHATTILDFNEYEEIKVVGSNAAIACPVEESGGPPGRSKILIREADANLIVNAPADIDFLLTDNRRLSAALQQLADGDITEDELEVGEFYCKWCEALMQSSDGYTGQHFPDCGSMIAQKALGATDD